MMKRYEERRFPLGAVLSLLFLYLASFLISAAPTMAHDEDTDINFNVLVGSRKLSDEEWKDKNELYAGFDIDMKSASWPIFWMLGFHSSSATKVVVADSVTEERPYTITEFNLGARMYFPVMERTRLYAGGGLAGVNAEGVYMVNEPVYTKVDDSSYGLGYFLNGGGDLRMGRYLHAGFDIRFSGGTKLDGGTDVNDIDSALFFGWGF